MVEARLNIRIDADLKSQAELVFQKLGLTMSSGVNIFLSKVVAEQGIPFPLTLQHTKATGERHNRFENAAKHIHEETEEFARAGKPVAGYNEAEERPRLEYSDNLNEYNIEEL